MDVSPPPLAQYLSISKWTPEYGDFIIWTKWFTSWYGFVVDLRDGMVYVTVEGTPALLLTMTESEMASNLKSLSIADIKSKRKGRWTVQQTKNGSNVWYI